LENNHAFVMSPAYEVKPTAFLPTGSSGLESKVLNKILPDGVKAARHAGLSRPGSAR